MTPSLMNGLRRSFLTLMLSVHATLAHAQDAAPADRNAINTRARPGDMMADSPVTFPKQGALPAQYPPDVKDRAEASEKDYFIFSTPCRSLAQIAAIQKDMPAGQFSKPPADWTHLRRTRRILAEGGDLRLLALGDSIVNDTMRSGWVAQLQEAYPKARIEGTVYVRGGGGCQHYREEGRVEKHILPRKPDLVYIGGISQKDIESIGEVIRQVRAGLPEVEILLATGTFGTADPRDPATLAKAQHSGTGAYGQALKALAAEQRCAYLDMTGPWAEYIRSSKVHPHLFYRDVVHANEFGEQILAKIMMSFFAPEHASAVTAASQTLVFDQPQLAGISGFRAFWDTPIMLAEDGPVAETERNPGGTGPNAVWSPEKRDGGTEPGAIVFDALHRAVLVRFPGSAQRIAESLRQGLAVERVELLLPHQTTELWAEGYAEPPGMSFLGDAWEKKKPRWHAVAWALRQPWVADRERGPTFNASVNSLAYWKRFGAQDENEDRYPQRFGPAEVSEPNPEGRLDLTTMLTDGVFSATLADRLCALEGNGVLLRKWETYDLSYWHGGYEWGSATGGRGIIIRKPKLVVTLKPASPAPAISGDLAVKLPPTKRGQPTAVMPDAGQIRAFAAKHVFQRPGWMPDWQWQRMQELKAIGKIQDYPGTPEAYGKWMDAMLAKPPRTWDGFQAAEMTQDYALFAGTWPAPVRQHWELYWWAWLMPDRDIKDLVQGYIGGQQNQGYIQRTGDWRGNASVYRTYCRDMGTMNFNHWAANGTLLGGHILGSEAMLAEGRYGLEKWPLRTWCWFDGSTQETLDHYYFSISLKEQKVFADFGPSSFDRMMGRNILAKSVGELATLYHPSLKRFISSSGRTGIAYLLTIQDGTKHIIHTLSKRGALTDVGRTNITGGLPMLGHDADPGVIAQQTLNGPWADEWLANVVDDKPLPFETTASYKQWGGFGATPLWKRSYLGQHYGLATFDVAIGNQTVPLMAQWRRDDRPADTTEQVGTLLARFGVNRTEFLDSVWHGEKNRNPNGSIGQQGGFIASLQHRNKLLAFASPYPELIYSGDRNLGSNITSVQTSIALLDLQPKPTWEIYLNGRRVESWPVKATFGQRFTIKDGATFIGIIPLPGATDLGRDAEVVLSAEGEPTEMQGGGKLKTTLVLNLYNHRSAAPLDRKRADLDDAWGGFALEMGDATEFPDFAAFQKHILGAKIEARWDAAEKTVHATFASGRDTLEAGFKPGYTGDWDKRTPTDQCFPYRRVNGGWPYLAKDVERDTTLSQISRTGLAEKGGARLTVEPGRMACVEFEPRSGVFVGYTPLPDETAWRFEAPGGIVIETDGKVGMLRITLWTKENRLTIEHADRPGHGSADVCSLRITGMSQPAIVLNGSAATLSPDGLLKL